MEHVSDELDLETLVKTRDLCVCFNVRKASRAITQIYEEEMQSLDVHAGQYSMLIAIPFIGAEGIGALSEALVTDRTTITRNLKPLVEKGLVEYVSGEDKRRRAVRLTKRGRETVNQAYPLWQKAQARVLNEIDRDRFDVMKAFANDAVKLARGA